MTKKVKAKVNVIRNDKLDHLSEYEMVERWRRDLRFLTDFLNEIVEHADLERHVGGGATTFFARRCGSSRVGAERQAPKNKKLTQDCRRSGAEERRWKGPKTNGTERRSQHCVRHEVDLEVRNSVQLIVGERIELADGWWFSTNGAPMDRARPTKEALDAAADASDPAAELNLLASPDPPLPVTEPFAVFPPAKPRR